MNNTRWPTSAAFTPGAAARWVFSTPGAQQDHILAALHERQTGQLPDDLTIDAWLEAEVELLQRFDSWQTSLFQPGFHSALMSAVLFLLQRHAQECRLILG